MSSVTPLGIIPVRLLFDRSNRRGQFMFAMFLGMGPERLLLERLRNLRALSSKREGGMAELSWFLWR